MIVTETEAVDVVCLAEIGVSKGTNSIKIERRGVGDTNYIQ